MSIFDIFRSKKKPGNTEIITITETTNIEETAKNKETEYADASSIDPDEKSYYQPDEYYTFVSFPDTPFESKVITLEERKATTYPSKNGLYVGEILLLDYCSLGTYPKPKNGYPGFWWFEYGIRDVGHALESLASRGFITWAPKDLMLEKLKVPQLKNILISSGLPTTGKKADLLERIRQNVPEENWPDMSSMKKYILTDKGISELEDNAYIPYMHQHRHATTEKGPIGETFNVWDMNRLIAKDGRQSEWKSIIGAIEEKRFGVNMASYYPKSASTSPVEEDSTAQRDSMRAFLKAKRPEILEAAKTHGDGYDEESRGIDYRSIGKDKEALVQFYISIEKKFDAPALYWEAAYLLRKYGLYEEELEVLQKAMSAVPDGNHHKEGLVERKEEVQAIIRAENIH